MTDTNATHPHGQAPITAPVTAFISLLILLWAGNSVVVKLTVRDFHPLWAAFLRFGPAVPFLGIVAWRLKVNLKIGGRHLLAVALLGVQLFVQILLFNAGSQHTTGGRVTLFIFAYPLMVPWFAAALMHQERLRGQVLIGSAIAFAGLAFALRSNLHGAGETLRGDLLELASASVLAFGVALNKRLTYSIDKWKVLFWRFTVAVVLFGLAAALTEPVDFTSVRPDAWASLAYQSIVISMFCFGAFQWLLARHNSSSFSVFFFATPLAGMLIGMVLLDEPFDPGLLVGCILVGIGIWVVNARRRPSAGIAAT